MNKIEDFGEKIGGARKDLWKARGLQFEDTIDMTVSEKHKYVTRDYVWPLPDAKKQVENGMSPFVAFWIREVRKKAHKEPYLRKTDDFDEKAKAYIKAVSELKEITMAVQSEQDFEAFYKELRKHSSGYYFKEEWLGIIDSDLLLFESRHPRMRRICLEKNFPYTTKRKNKNSKRGFIPPQLESIEREGERYRIGNVSADQWQKVFSFRGVEFGNWMSQKDRQVSMNYCFDALKDLAIALDIEDKSIAFDGTLGLGFGSRGRGNASAHYESELEVINLTKMHGAGCTAREWMHALDDRIAKACGYDNGKLASEQDDKSKLPQTFVKLVRSLVMDAEGNKTDYFRGSKSFDNCFKKEPYGYWASAAEMLARAFACYIKDTLGMKSDYLIAHADAYVFEFENMRACAIPQGEERELFNEEFDMLFYELKQLGILSKRREAPVIQKERKESIVYKAFSFIKEDIDGQLQLCV